MHVCRMYLIQYDHTPTMTTGTLVIDCHHGTVGGQTFEFLRRKACGSRSPSLLCCILYCSNKNTLSARGSNVAILNLVRLPLSQSVDYTFSSHLGLIRCLTLIVRVSTQHHIHAFTNKIGDIHEIILP